MSETTATALDPETSAPPPRRLILLGSTGSIGLSSLDVVAHLNEARPGAFDVIGLAAGRNGSALREQAAAFDVDHVAIADPAARDALAGVPHVHAGEAAAVELIEAIGRPGDLVLGAMMGSAGVPATLAAIERGCDIALANKETLVAAGGIVMARARERGVNLLPVDSEHGAVAQCLRAGRSVDEVQRLVLTASGGPFRTWDRGQLDRATPEEALAHPTWSMGRKITVDSATMMNKALEVIEAHWLFGLPAERIEVVVHPQSVVHSFVEFVDGSVMAQLGPPDMRTPIQYALTWPHRVDGCARRMDWAALRQLDFEPVDDGRFPAVALAGDVVRAGGTAGAIFNAANEEAVAAFLDGAIGFPRIVELVADAIASVPSGPAADLDDVIRADRTARANVREAVAGAVEA